MLKVVQPKLRQILDDRVAVDGKTVHLFQNNHDVTRNTVLADLTECDFDGYAPLDPAWVPSVASGAEDVALAPSLIFEAGAGLAGPQTVYGYYVTDEDDELSWAETFEDGPTTIAVVGQELEIFPQLKLKNYGE